MWGSGRLTFAIDYNDDELEFPKKSLKLGGKDRGQTLDSDLALSKSLCLCPDVKKILCAKAIRMALAYIN